MEMAGDKHATCFPSNMNSICVNPTAPELPVVHILILMASGCNVTEGLSLLCRERILERVRTAVPLWSYRTVNHGFWCMAAHWIELKKFLQNKGRVSVTRVNRTCEEERRHCVYGLHPRPEQSGRVCLLRVLKALRSLCKCYTFALLQSAPAFLALLLTL